MKKMNLEFFLILLISIGFVIWAGIFIYQSSFVTIDGTRSFSLFDDAMVSMRYAWNFSHGYGLVWNAGERVQGYTNLLMTLLMSLATLVFSKTKAVLVVQLSGIAFMLATAFLNMKIADHIIHFENPELRILTRVVSFSCGLAYYPLSYWSLMGMETGLLTVLVFAGLLTAFNYLSSRDNKQLLLFSVLMSLAFLTRNDSSIFAIAIWLYIIYDSKLRGGKLGQLITSMGLYLFVIVGELAFQYLYYGELLPNTYTLKLTGMPLVLRLQGGIGFTFPFLMEVGYILAFSVLDLIFYFRKEKLLLFLITLLSVSYEIYVGGDPWNYWRLMAASIPLSMILNLDFITSILTGFKNTSAYPKIMPGHPAIRNVLTGLLILLFMSVGILQANGRFFSEISFQAKPYLSSDSQKTVNISIVLNQILSKNATVGVLWAGAIPYYTDFKAVDFLGKSDRYIASLPPDLSGHIKGMGMQSVPGHNKYDLYYSIVTLKPTYVQSLAWGRQDLSKWAKDKYVRVKYKGRALYLLKGSPDVLWSKLLN